MSSSFVFQFSLIAEFLGLKDTVSHSPEAIDAVDELLSIWEMQTAEVQCILQTISGMETIPSNYAEVAASLRVLPTVVEWLKRSAYRRGVAMTLALGQAQFPEDWVHDEITSGWPSETDEVDVFTVQTQQQRAVPFADRMRRMDGL